MGLVPRIVETKGLRFQSNAAKHPHARRAGRLRSPAFASTCRMISWSPDVPRPSGHIRSSSRTVRRTGPRCRDFQGGHRSSPRSTARAGPGRKSKFPLPPSRSRAGSGRSFANRGSPSIIHFRIPPASRISLASSSLSTFSGFSRKGTMLKRRRAASSTLCSTGL